MYEPENLDSTAVVLNQPVLPVAGTSKLPSSGITLVLPSLTALKQQNVAKSKRKSGARHNLIDEVKKPPRPLKLKPLKEVLSKLIALIKKKDDYAFFLKPVDPNTVTGYSDVVKRPMDFGTMTAKVTRGRYRSLEEFASDLRLVTGNAKLFNSPGTIYYTEAERIEAWGLDHIAKAAPTVIEYETDWNIDVEQDFEDPLDGQALQVDDANDHLPGTPVESRRSVSVTSIQVQQVLGRRSTRGPQQQQQQQKKAGNSGKLSESLEPDGHFPGYKDGVGVFPPGSDLAELMLSLKLKGKKYRTKKERLRIEKGGPPLAADGSLDYTQLEDPFSVLSAFVPDPPTRPRLTPLYPTDPSHPFRLEPTCIPPDDRPEPILSTITTLQAKLPSGQRRHWTIARSAPQRGRVKDREEDEQGSLALPPREAHTTDWGSLALLTSALHAEMAVRTHGQTTSAAADTGAEEEEEEEAVKEAIRDGLDQRRQQVASTTPADLNIDSGTASYWTPARATEGEIYIQDVVYGGEDGYAYVRSLAEFVGGIAPLDRMPNDSHHSGLGMPLAHWVEQNIVDPLTGGRHMLLRETIRLLTAHTPKSTKHPPDAINDQISLSLYKYPSAMAQLTSLRQIMTHHLDMSALLLQPGELFESEEVWAGREWKRQKAETAAALDARGSADVKKEDATKEGKTRLGDGSKYEEPEMLQYVMEQTVGMIMAIDSRLRAARSAPQSDDLVPGAASSSRPLKRKREDDEEDAEDKKKEELALRTLRLNLLSLAKRAPLEKIARLPADMVPEHIRLYVPTLG